MDTAPKKPPGRPFQPGVSGNPNGRPKGDGLVRELILEAFENTRAEALEALERRLKSPKTVQEVLELMARLDGELSKESADGRGVQIILLNNTGPHPLDPEVFREAAAKRVLLERNGRDGDGGE